MKRIETFKTHLDRDPRLAFVFRLCRDLGIDDPPAWFNAVPTSLVDWWLSFYLLELEQNNSEGAAMSPEQAGQFLGNL